MIVRKADFSEFVEFTQNIPDNKINPHINTTQVKLIRPVLGQTLYTAVLAVGDASPVEWAAGTAFSAAGLYAYKDNVMYVSLQATTGDDPATSPLYWSSNPIGTFWLVYVKPWAVFECFAKFLLWHGKNITQFGIRIQTDDTSIQVTGSERADLIDDVNTSAGTYKSLMLNYLCDVEWTIDSVVYTVDCTDFKDEPSFSIRPGGTKKTYTDQ